MRVWMINDHLLSTGGTENYIRMTSAMLVAAGDRVSVLYGAGGVQPAGPVRYECIPELLPLPVYSRDDRLRVLSEWIDRLQPDVIQFNNFDEASLVEWFARRLPCVQFVHVQSRYVCPGEGKYYRRQETACRRPFGPYCLIAPFLHQCGTQRPLQILAHYRTVADWLIASKLLTRLITGSNYMRRELETAGIPGAKIVVNPLGVEMRFANGDATIADRPRVLFCGRLHAQKGVDHLIRALQWVGPPCTVEIIGEGPEKQQLLGLAERLGGPHQIEFIDWIEPKALEERMQRAELLVMPSRWPEPFGLAGLEAMRFGVPVIAYQVGGILQWLKDGNNGLVVPPSDVQQLGMSIHRVLTDSDLRLKLRRGARATARELSLDGHVQSLRTIYRDAVGAFRPEVASRGGYT